MKVKIIKDVPVKKSSIGQVVKSSISLPPHNKVTLIPVPEEEEETITPVDGQFAWNSQFIWS